MKRLSLSKRRFRARLSPGTNLVLGLVLVSPAMAQLDTTYRLVFAEEFNGTAVETTKWAVASPGWTMPNSLSVAAANQVSVADGVLTLNAVRTATSGTTQFSSGSVSSYGKYSFDGGYVESSIDLPSKPGSWPAFWGLYTGWPPEADIMEYPLSTDGGTNGYLNNAYHTAFHYTNTSGAAAAGAGKVTTGQNLHSTGSHIFAMDWASDASVKFFLDGAQKSSFTSATDVAEMVNMYMILDYAVGGWPGTPTTTQWPLGASDQTKVDWVRVWRKNPNGDTTSDWKLNGGGSFTASGNWTNAIVPKYGNQTARFRPVGNAAAASITLPDWIVFGGITFDGAAAGNTAYTIGSSSNLIQLAGQPLGATPVGSTVQATSISTVNQVINARLELWSDTTLRNDMTGGQFLILNGIISGNGDLIVNGPGTVQFGNNNIFTGDTSIGSSEGLAVARVMRSNPFGTTGTVTLGPNGNTTTARIEIQDVRTVPNNINFSGRNNASVGIRNLAADNTFSGTISAQTGGGSYVIQSDAGLLTLSGAAASANGVALRAGATGSRTFTLQGAGNGLVSGGITNGSGTVSIIKSGTGTWTLTGSNSHTGTTNLSSGTLVVNGSIAAGGTFTAASATVLKGSGSISAAATINGTHQPGAGSGTQNFGALTYGTTARLGWELTSNSDASGFDRVFSAGTVRINGGAAVDVILNSPGSLVNLSNLFWTQPRSWQVITASSIADGPFALGTVSSDPAGRMVSGYGTLSLQQTATAVSVVFTPYTPQQFWLRQYFGAGWNNPLIAANSADPDRDGATNLTEWALGMNPTVADAMPWKTGLPGLPVNSITRVGGLDYLTLQVRRPVGLTDISYRGKVSNDLILWRDAQQGATTLNGDGSETVLFIDTEPVGAHGHRFIRLDITQ